MTTMHAHKIVPVNQEYVLVLIQYHVFGQIFVPRIKAAILKLGNVFGVPNQIILLAMMETLVPYRINAQVVFVKEPQLFVLQ
jgi:hypothetical protein